MNGPHTVLNVEDTPENRYLVRRILESEGYRVVDAVSALEGIEKAGEIRPDLILMDINLPDLDGFTAVSRIRSFMSTVPIIAVTARNVSNDRERARAIGCDGYLNKPIDIDQLISEIANHLAAGHRVDEDVTEREFYLKEQNLALIEELESKFSELQAAYERLKHLEEAKSNFISVASHELRTPLTVIHSYSQMLETLPAIESDPVAREMLSGVARGAARLREIINDMVSVIRVELTDRNFDFAPVSVRNLMKNVEEEHSKVVTERRLKLEGSIAKDLPMVNGDLKQLQSAISRIVGNAIKYTPDGGEIKVSAQLLEKTKDEEQTFVEIVVADKGVGIDVDKQKLIFDKFSTAENVALHSTSKTQFMGGGAGLGLTIAKGIVESHNGRIWVESDGYDPETLPGSKFFILLPTY